MPGPALSIIIVSLVHFLPNCPGLVPMMPAIHSVDQSILFLRYLYIIYQKTNIDIIYHQTIQILVLQMNRYAFVKRWQYLGLNLLGVYFVLCLCYVYVSVSILPSHETILFSPHFLTLSFRHFNFRQCPF